MKIKWYEEKPGQSSAMRIMTMITVVTGCIVALSGAVSVFLGFGEGVALAGAGTGMVAAAGFAKAWQQKTEGRDE